MPAVIQVERDIEGLHQAFAGLFVQSFERALVDASAAAQDPEAHARLLDSGVDLPLSPGYYDRARYLFELRSAIDSGVVYSPRELERTDVEGLQVMARAKQEFEREHPACGNCGARQESRFNPHCRSCKVEFFRGGD